MFAHGIRRSPVVTPDITIGQGDDEVGKGPAVRAQQGSLRKPRNPIGPTSVLQRSIDLYRYLLMNRIVFVAGYINDKVLRSAALRHTALVAAALGFLTNLPRKPAADECWYLLHRWRPRLWAPCWP